MNLLSPTLRTENTPCNQQESASENICLFVTSLLFDSEDGGSIFYRNVSKILQDHFLDNTTTTNTTNTTTHNFRMS
jgi:hypothetical protein